MTTVQVPATTTNLGPGFDALGLALTLYNCVTVTSSASWETSVVGEGARSIPRDHRNLAARAVRRCFAEAGREPPSLRLTLENRIPVARGLGSSAAAIVGGLVAANRLLPEPLSTDRLLAIAAELEGHPDNVTPALLGGLQVACVDQGMIRRLQLPVPSSLRAVVAIPEVEISTEKARSVLPAFVPRRDAVFNVGRAALLVAAMATGATTLLGTAMDDRLHQPYRADLLPGFEAALAAARDAGAAGACLSGAGSALLALVTGDEEAVGGAMCTALGNHGVRARWLLLGVDEAGAQVVQTDAAARA